MSSYVSIPPKIIIKSKGEILQDEKVLDIGFMTKWIYLTLLNYIAKNT